MTFTSLSFLGFVILALFVYYLLPQKWRWIVLLVASYTFYGIVCYKYFGYIVFTTLSTFFGGKLLFRYMQNSTAYLKTKKDVWSREEKSAYKDRVTNRKKWIVAAVLVLNFGILAFLKYYNFFATSVTALFSSFGAAWGIPELGLVLPLGISFYTFQSMGYLIDIYRNKYEPETNVAKFALFVSFFPQIVQGPISFYKDLAPQLLRGNAMRFENIKHGAMLALWGLFKKLIIADRLSGAIHQVTENQQNHPGIIVLLIALFYAVQLYTDFSGGIDIARGVAQMFGIVMPENFRRPYFSRSISEYWHRWHITLGAWLREYLFYPLAMSKVFLKFGKKIKGTLGVQMGKVLPTSIASLITFIVIGIWHGANWKYVAFGCWNGLIIMISTLLEPQFKKWMQALKIQPKSWWFIGFQMIRTFIIVLIGYYFDIAQNLTDAFVMMYRSVFDWQVGVLGEHPDYLKQLGLNRTDCILVGIGILILLAVSIIQEKTQKDIRTLLDRRTFVLRGSILMIGALSIVVFGVYGPGFNPADFVYMQF